MKNSVTLIGNVGAKDAEITTTPGGNTVARFSLATSKEIKDGDVQTQWHTIVAWNGTAKRPLLKGMYLMIEGEIQYRKYTDKDGIERNITEILAWSIYEIAKRPKSDVPLPTEDDMPVHPRAVQNMSAADKEVKTPF